MSRGLLDRFWEKVDTTGECWIWKASQDGHGYGQITVAGVPIKAHRVAYELNVGPIPSGFAVDHLCRVKLCVRPSHLEPVTPSENTRRQLAAIGHHNSKRTHCPNGHPYDETNTRYGRTTAGGVGRWCKTCHREADRRWRERRRARV